MFLCSVCGFQTDRDLNAARIVLELVCSSVSAGYVAVGFEDVDRINGDLLR